MISFAVVGHQSRLVAATDLARNLGAVLAVDDGTAGVNANHRRAWELTAATTGAAWSAVVEDDAQPVDGFIAQAEAALAVAPAPIVSFYLGRTRPAHVQFEIRRALHRAGRESADWIVAEGVFHAVALAMRSGLRDDWLAFAAQDHGTRLPTDELMALWCRLRGHAVAYTVPSLVEHADGESLVPYSGNHTAPRKAWRVGTRETWTRHAVKLL